MATNKILDELEVGSLTFEGDATIDGESKITLGDEWRTPSARPINEVYDEHPVDSVFYLPEGTYELTDTVTGDVDVAGFIGEPRATINVIDQPNPPDLNESERGVYTAFSFGSSSNPIERMVLKNITVDIDRDGPNGNKMDCGLVEAFVTDYGEFINVELRGQRERHQDVSGTYYKFGDRETVKLVPMNQDSVTYCRGLKMMDGGLYQGNVESTLENSTGYAIGVSGSDGNSEGTAIYDNCRLAGFIDNGFYVKNTENRVILRGCYAENCSSTAIRPSSNDRVENCEIYIDNGITDYFGAEQASQTGLFLNEADNCVVDGVKITVADGRDTNDMLRFLGTESGTMNHNTVRNVTIESGSDNVLVDIQDPTDDLLIENLDIIDTGSPGFSGAIVMRPGTDATVTMRNCTIDSEERAAVMVRGDGTSLYMDGCEITAGNTPDHSGGSSDCGIYMTDFDDSGSVMAVGDVRLTNCTFNGETGWALGDNDTVRTLTMYGNRFPNISSADDVFGGRWDGTVNEYQVYGNPGWNPTVASDYYDIQVNGTDGEGIINFKTE